MLKDIILHLERDPSRDIVRDFAASIAEVFSAHLTAVIFNFEANIPAEALEDLFAASEAEARGAIERFKLAMKRGNLSAEPRLVSGTSKTFSEMARCFDLSVVMQSDDHKGVNNSILIETTLFDSGRPLIIVPNVQQEALKLEKVVCCWDGSRTAARAINDALPFLKRASTVELLIVEDEKTANEQVLRGTVIGQHLARHDIKVRVETIPAVDMDVANTILRHIAGGSTSLLVMGGYGHSRLREFVFGGATRGMLSAMTVPVFMSH
ncbi:Universal stress protein, UspA [Nitrobacter sp. Nb-311A]|uniref:universal stress protein n=1 Tax=unclassified Nitrobacter TaxID=2620411 RepID=UPI0000685E35|nr:MULTISPECIES: universal stress protein [unclassified Nitrobacter]EAQ35209.1 Universal stress protein, UspA [Nitrobacter sp. Nb-311A]MCB1393970.1 universal stress protein [Nitrobacter sp.]MCV0386558.1 universal stress protein [Nitrobacter sp.]